MSHIVTIAGSPSGSAKSSTILEYAQGIFRRRHLCAKSIVVRELPAEDLLHARLDSPTIRAASAAIEKAQGILIATPIYKAAYSGVLKAFLDVLPSNAFQGKTLLPIVTGGSSAHLLALDYALKPVLSALGACHILQGVTITDAQVQFEHGGVLRLEESVEQRLRASLEDLVASVQWPVAARLVEEPPVSFPERNGAHRRAVSEVESLLEGFQR